MFHLFARVSRRCAKGLFQKVNSPRGSAKCLGLKKRSLQLGSPGIILLIVNVEFLLIILFSKSGELSSFSLNSVNENLWLLISRNAEIIAGSFAMLNKNIAY